MATKLETERKGEKAVAVIRRLGEIHPNLMLFIGMMDESRLDQMILALGLGDVELRK